MNNPVERNNKYLAKARQLSVLPTLLDIFDVQQHNVFVSTERGMNHVTVSIINHRKENGQVKDQTSDLPHFSGPAHLNKISLKLADKTCEHGIKFLIT